MAGLNVTLSDGKVVTINAGEKLEDVKAKFGENAATIFDGIDANDNGTLEVDELTTLKTKLTDNNYTVEVAQDGKTPKRAYNDAMQNMRSRYNQDTLKDNFKQDDADKWEVKSGHTLWKIAKDTLESEGLPTDQRSINDRIAQIANLNGINDVNNVRVGLKLVYKLTDAGVAKVKAAENNSAVAFGSGVNQGVNQGVNGGVRQNQPANSGAPAGGRGTDTVSVETPVTGKESTITVSPNGLNMGSGMPVDKDGNELKDANGNRNFKDPKFKANGSVMKYTSGDTVMYQITIAGKPNTMSEGVKLSASTIAEVKEMKAKFDAAIAKLKKVDENAADDVKKQTQEANLAALKEAIEVTGGNVQVIKNAAYFLKDDSFVDRTSDDYKSLVQDLILTRNADVLKGLLYKDGNANADVLTNDKTAHEYLAGLYQEIRAKEKNGDKLTDEEIALKNVVANMRGYYGYEIAEQKDADGNVTVHEKYMAYNNMDGTPMYEVEIGDNWYYATTPELLEEFLTALDKAPNDADKTILFNNYIDTKDVELAKCLAQNIKTLKAANESIIKLINNNGLDVIQSLPTDDMDKSVVDAVVARAKTIYTTDKGNLENAVYLENVIDWIDKTDLSDDDKAKAKTEILETYFEATTAEDGTKTYEFKPEPNRRATYEEMQGLCKYISPEMQKAVLKDMPLEDFSKGQYGDAFDYYYNTTPTVAEKYSEFVDNMSEQDVMKFINEHTYINWSILPYDKIVEKFADKPEVLAKLLETFDCNNPTNATISDESRVKFAKTFMTDDGKGNITFDPKKLPQGVNIDALINVLPQDCSQGEGAKLYDAILNSFTKVPDDGDYSLNKLLRGHHRKVGEAPQNKAKLMQLVDTIVIGSANGNELIDDLRWNYDLTEDEKAKLYAKCSDEKKRDMIKYSDYTKDGALHIVKSGETIDTIVKNYLRTHLEKFPKLKKSVEDDPDKWTPERITEALDDYMIDFRKDILNDLGITDPTKLIAGKTIIDLDKIKWDERQPNWFNYNFNY